MQAGSVYRIRTTAANQFTAALAQNAALSATLDCFEAVATFTGDKMGIGAGKHLRSRLRELRIISAENLAWEVWLFGTVTMGGAVIGAEKFLGRWSFVAADGAQATGDTFWYYYVPGLDLAIENLDLPQTGKFYIRLVNRSAAAKSADGPGAIEIELALELLQGR